MVINAENRRALTPAAGHVGLIGLLVLTCVSRLPFRSQILYHWDSVNFAFAMRHFDVLHENPQPPGYIVYVWLSRLVDLLFHNANTTMVWISVVASGLAVVAIYLLGQAMWGQAVGVVAALLLASSPLFWFYGEIALPHALDTGLMLVAVWWLYRIRQGESRWLWPAIVLLSVIGGVRQQSLFFLLPVALYAMWREGWKRILLAAAVGMVLCGLWFVPLIMSSGGVTTYLDKMNSFSARFQAGTSVLMGAGWSGIVYNGRKLFLYTLYGWAGALVPAVILLAGRLARWKWPPFGGQKGLFLLLWVAPSLAFYLLIHMGQQGLIFAFLPVLLLAGAVGIVRLTQARVRILLAAGLMFGNVAIFCLFPEYPLGPGSQRLLTRSALVNTDRYYQERLTILREKFSPQHTVIVAANWEHLAYYLPDYTLLHLAESLPNRPAGLMPSEWPGKGGEPGIYDLGLVPDDKGRVAVIVFDDNIANLLHIAPNERVSLPDGNEMEVLWLGVGELLQCNTVRLEVVKP